MFLLNHQLVERTQKKKYFQELYWKKKKKVNGQQLKDTQVSHKASRVKAFGPTIMLTGHKPKH